MTEEIVETPSEKHFEDGARVHTSKTALFHTLDSVNYK